VLLNASTERRRLPAGTVVPVEHGIFAQEKQLVLSLKFCRAAASLFCSEHANFTS